MKIAVLAGVASIMALPACARSVPERDATARGSGAAPADSLTLNLTCPAPGTAHVWYVMDGPNSSLNEFGSIHEVLSGHAQPGDLVCIMPRAGGLAWNEKFDVQLNNLTIRGLPDNAGAFPIIDGNNAFAYNTSSGYQEGVIRVLGSDSTHVSGVTIENLEVIGGKVSQTIQISGGSSTYGPTEADNPAAIRLDNADDTTIRNCKIHATWIGIGGNEKECTAANTGTCTSVYEGNFIYDTDGGDTYTEGYGTAFYQFNRFAACSTSSGAKCKGNQLKDRTYNTVVRYNRFDVTEDDGYAVDLDEGSCRGTVFNTGDPSLLSEVYGNIFIHDDTNPQHSIVHFGGDNCSQQVANADQTTQTMAEYRRNLRFYNNTISIKTSSTSTTVLLLPWQNNPVTVLARNNVIYATESAFANSITLQRTLASPGFSIPPYALSATFTHDWRSQGSSGQHMSFGDASGSGDASEVEGAPGETPVLDVANGMQQLFPNYGPDRWNSYFATVLSGSLGMQDSNVGNVCPASNNCIQTGAPYLDYQLYFPNPGVYNVWVRAYIPATSESMITVYSENMMGTGSGLSSNDIKWTTTGCVWSNTASNGSAVTLAIPSAGLYHFQVGLGNAGVVVDKIEFTIGKTPSGTGDPESSQSSTVEDPTTWKVTNLAIHHHHWNYLADDGAVQWSTGGSQWNLTPRGWTSSDGTPDHGAALPIAGYAWLMGFVGHAPAVEWQIKVNTKGRHWIWVYGSAPSTSSNLVHFGLDGAQRESLASVSLPIGSSPSWTNIPWGASEPAYIDVDSSGYHTLNMWAGKDGARVDRVLLSTSIAFDPTINGYADPVGE